MLINAASDAAKARAEVMSVGDQFRANASKCIKRAAGLTDPEHKQLYYDLAVQWLALAAEVEAHPVAVVPADVKAVGSL
jgi:hypothetical protein